MPDRRWPSAGVRRSGAASARCHPRVTSTATRAGDVLWLALASGCSVARWLGVPPCSRRGVVAVAHVLPCSHAGLPRVRLCGGSSASPLEGCSRARRRAAVARSLARRHAAVAPLRRLRLQPRGALPSHDDPPVIYILFGGKQATLTLCHLAGLQTTH